MLEAIHADENNLVWYFGYGANMSKEVLKNRGVKPK